MERKKNDNGKEKERERRNRGKQGETMRKKTVKMVREMSSRRKESKV